jgi:hypothetical protein
MDRIEEALLAFVGTGEVQKKPLRLSEQSEANQQRVHNLLSEGMVSVEGDSLKVTIKGWRHLDTRPQP